MSKSEKRKARFAATAAALEANRLEYLQATSDSSLQTPDLHQAWRSFLFKNPHFVPQNNEIFHFTKAQTLRAKRRALALLTTSQSAGRPLKAPASRSRPSKTAGLTPESSLAVPDSASNTGSRSMSRSTGSGSLKRERTAPIVPPGDFDALSKAPCSGEAGRPHDPAPCQRTPSREPRTR
jgi:hypothetical protein